MARKTNSQIRKKWLILCEGRDAEEFLISYLIAMNFLMYLRFLRTFRLWISEE